MPPTANQEQSHQSAPAFHPGDLVKIGWKIKEADKLKTVYFDGIVLGERGSGASKTVLVRKIAANGVGVERIFPLASPSLTSLVVKTKNKARRAKLYYLRKRVGKAAMRP